MGRYSQHALDPEKGHKLYKEYLDELVLGDELGYDALVVNEHHSTFYSLMPSCSVIAGALRVPTPAPGTAHPGAMRRLWHAAA